MEAPIEVLVRMRLITLSTLEMRSALQFQAVRLAAGLGTSDDLRKVADDALNAGIYSPELAEVAIFSEHRLATLAP